MPPVTPAGSRVVVIEFAESGPSLRRIEVAEVTFPARPSGRRRHRRSRLADSRPVALQVALLVLIAVVAVVNPAAGAGIAGTVLAGVFGLAVTRGPRAGGDPKRDEDLP